MQLLQLLPILVFLLTPLQCVSTQSCHCGSVSTTPKGGISFKPFESILPNERCAWTIRVPRAYGYNLTISKLNPTTGEEPPVIVASFELKNQSLPTYHSMSTKITNTLLNVNATILVITYTTPAIINDNTTAGFILQYTALGLNISSSKEVAGRSEGLCVTSQLSHLRHPVVGPNYVQNELNTFIFMETNHISGHNNAFYRYIRTGISDHCPNFVTVFTYNACSMRWQQVQRFCGGNDTLQISSSDMVLIVFESGNFIGNGFHWTYVAGGE